MVGFFAMPMPTQPLGWFKDKVEGPEGLQGLKYRTVGLAADLFQKMGLAVAQLPGGEILPAMERGVIDAFEFNNPTSDSRFGAQDVAKNYMLGSLSPGHRVLRDHLQQGQVQLAARRAPGDSGICRRGRLDRQSGDRPRQLLARSGQAPGRRTSVQVWRTPQSILDAQLKAWDELLPDLTADPFFAKVVESQKAWVDRVVFYGLYNAADQRLAYEHFFKPLDI